MTGRLVVRVAGERAGLLAADATGRHVFAYDPGCPGTRFVSLTMPVRLESYAWHELHPVFQCALPDGEALATLARGLERSGAARPLDLLLLALPGAPGRLAVAPEGAPAAPAGAEPPAATQASDALRPHFAFAAWCALRVARRAGFDVPPFALSADRRTLTVERFDRAAGVGVGYEDFCALMGLGAAGRFDATAERMVSAATAFVAAVQRTAVRRELFRRHALAHLFANAEAHLRAFGVVYGGADDVRLAPLRVALTALPGGRAEAVPALSIGGQRSFALKKGTWRRFGAHCALSDRESLSILQWLGQAVEAERAELERDAVGGEREVLAALLADWRAGAGALVAGF